MAEFGMFHYALPGNDNDNDKSNKVCAQVVGER